MRKYLIAFIIGILLVPTAFYVYLRSGHAPVAASASPLPFERFFAKLAMRATLSHEHPKPQGGPPAESDLASGAKIYRQYCGDCHGLPHRPPTVISKGMYPHPPQFFHARPDQPRKSAGPYHPASPKVYWKVKNGVRLTGMPGFQDSFTAQQILQVSQFVSNARNLPPGVVAVLEGNPETPPRPTPASKSHQQAASRHP